MKTTVIESGKDNKKTANSKLRPDVRLAPNASKVVTPVTPEKPAADPDKAPENAAPTPQPQQPVNKLSLDKTLQLVHELHRKMQQRERLVSALDELNAFEVELKESADVTDGNTFQRCELGIEDDKGRAFLTKNPVIIAKVKEYINRLCLDRLAEIEADIVLP